MQEVGARLTCHLISGRITLSWERLIPPKRQSKPKAPRLQLYLHSTIRLPSSSFLGEGRGGWLTKPKKSQEPGYKRPQAKSGTTFLLDFEDSYLCPDRCFPCWNTKTLISNKDREWFTMRMLEIRIWTCLWIWGIEKQNLASWTHDWYICTEEGIIQKDFDTNRITKDTCFSRFLFGVLSTDLHP